VNDHPVLTRTAQAVTAGTAVPWLEIVTVLAQVLVPILQACLTPTQAAGWLRGEDIKVRLGKKARVRMRELEAREVLTAHNVTGLVQDRTIETWRKMDGLTMTEVYNEAKG
jgi:hypothetical protein